MTTTGEKEDGMSNFVLVIGILAAVCGIALCAMFIYIVAGGGALVVSVILSLIVLFVGVCDDLSPHGGPRT
jgi:hypothetical protein